MRTKSNGLPRTLALALVLILSPCSGWASDPSTGPSPLTGSSAGSTRTTSTAGRKIILTGELVPMNTVKVFARSAGIVVKIHFREGKEFRSGEVMAEIDPVEYENGLDQAQAVLDRAVARLAAMDAGGRPEERDRSQAAVDSAQAVYNNTKANFDRMAGLLAKGGISQQTFDQSKRELDVAESQLAQARRTLDQVRVGPRPEEKAEGRAEVARCKADLRMAQLKLDYTKVRAPFDGTVAQRLVDEGGYVLAASSPQAPAICLFQDTSTLKAMVDLPERDLPYIRLGKSARVFVQAAPDRPFLGTVVNVYPFVESKTRTSKLEIHVPNSPPRLMAGMFVTAEIEAAPDPGPIVPDALSMPVGYQPSAASGR